MSTNYIDQIKDTQSTPVTHDIQEATDIRIFRATCSTAASTVAKVATLQDPKNFSLVAGVKVAVTFQYGNTQATPTLRVDGSSTGTSKNIGMWSDNSSILTGGGTTYFYWGPYETILFTYDGTRWVIAQGGAIYKAYALANSKGSGTITGVTAGTGLSGGGTSGTVTLNHSNSITAKTTSAVYPVKIDAQGHISEVGTAVTIPSISLNGSSTASPSFYAPTSAGTSGYVLKSNGSGAPTWTSAELTDEKLKVSTTLTTNSNYKIIFGSSSTTAETKLMSDAFRYVENGADQVYLQLGNSSKQGCISFFNKSSYQVELISDTLTTNRTITLPNKTGTVALTDDVPTITLNGSSTTSPSFYAPTGAGSSGQYLKSNGSGSPSWASITIPSITLNGSSTTSPSFYAPTGAGTSGQVLTSSGSGSPSWTTLSTGTTVQIVRW